MFKASGTCYKADTKNFTVDNQMNISIISNQHDCTKCDNYMFRFWIVVHILSFTFLLRAVNTSFLVLKHLGRLNLNNRFLCSVFLFSRESRRVQLTSRDVAATLSHPLCPPAGNLFDRYPIKEERPVFMDRHSSQALRHSD